MKDWRDCKKVTHSEHTLVYDGVEFQATKPNFEACHTCKIKECKAKVLLRATSRAMKAAHVSVFEKVMK